ncbi:MAG: hypothetical protein TECD_01143 [Hyphomicrobiaceae bacterium hypho_1]
MLDQTTTKGKIFAASMRLAAEYKWSEVTLHMISVDAGVSMFDLRKNLCSKKHIFELMNTTFDKAVLSSLSSKKDNQLPRDNIFETIMARFDVMEPYKKSIKSIFYEPRLDPRFLQQFLSSQKWMLEASGVSSEGVVGRVKTIGFASIYFLTFKVWIEDTDPGMARTMAELDRQIRRGEHTTKILSESINSFKQIFSKFNGCNRKNRKTYHTDNDPINVNCN